MKHVHPFASIALAAILLCGCTSSSPVEDEAEMLKALTTFLRAFENGDLDAMEASFSEDATSFRRTVMSNGITEPIEAAIYKRARSLRRRRCRGVKWVVGPCCASLCRSDFGGRPTRELLGGGRSR